MSEATNYFSTVISQEELTENLEIIQTYRLHIAQDINQENLALFCTSYNRYARMTTAPLCLFGYC